MKEQTEEDLKSLQPAMLYSQEKWWINYSRATATSWLLYKHRYAWGTFECTSIDFRVFSAEERVGPDLRGLQRWSWRVGQVRQVNWEQNMVSNIDDVCSAFRDLLIGSSRVLSLHQTTAKRCALTRSSWWWKAESPVTNVQPQPTRKMNLKVSVDLNSVWCCHNLVTLEG